MFDISKLIEEIGFSLASLVDPLPVVSVFFKTLFLIVSVFIFYKALNLSVKKTIPWVGPLLTRDGTKINILNSVLLRQSMFRHAFRYCSFLLLSHFAPLIGNPIIEGLIIQISNILIVVVSGMFVFVFLDVILDYTLINGSTGRFPVKSLTQLGKVIICVVCFVIIVSIMIDKSPAYLLGSLGALSAILMLLFRDSILGLIAGIQLAANRVVSIGDRIQLGDTEGHVEDISLTIVKVRNFDNTVTSLPCSELVNKPLKNWATMHDKGRRIKRKISIDVNSIAFINMIDAISISKQLPLKGYLTESTIKDIYSTSEISDECAHGLCLSVTNMRLFRSFIESYLKNNNAIIADESIVVRQVQSSETGIPLEIYCFAVNNAWSSYEDIQSNIFEYLFAVLPLFGLRMFQSPTGYDTYTLVKGSTDR